MTKRSRPGQNQEPSKPAPKPPKAGVILLGAALALVVLVVALNRPADPGSGSAPAPAPVAVGEAAPGETAPIAGSDEPIAKPPTTGGSTGGPNVAGGKAPLVLAPSGNSPAKAPVSGAMGSGEMPPDHPPLSTPGQEQELVSIQWLGHSCFYIFRGGSALVVDPFDSRVTGLPSPQTGAHLVAVSSAGPEHGFTEPVHAFQGEEQRVLKGQPGTHGKLDVKPIAASGPNGGANSIYVITAGDLRIAHLGNLGAPLTAAQAAAIGQVDVVMVPVSNGSLRPAGAVEICRKLGARIILPMAYSTPSDEGPAAKLPPLSAFVEASPYAVTTVSDNIILVGKNTLPPSPEIYRLQLKR